jgi:hypothetical protein
VPKEPPEPDFDPPLDDPTPEPDEPAETADALADAASDIDDALDLPRTSPDAKGISSAIKALRSARESIEPFLPADSDSTSDARAGLRDRKKKDR